VQVMEEPAQTPLWQESLVVHRFPSSQGIPLGWVLQKVLGRGAAGGTLVLTGAHFGLQLFEVTLTLTDHWLFPVVNKLTPPREKTLDEYIVAFHTAKVEAVPLVAKAEPKDSAAVSRR
jgi:hypothetical protein